MTGRDRDPAGRARNNRPRDGLGRPLLHDAEGVERVPDDLVLPPEESLVEAQRLIDAGRPFHAHEVLEGTWKAAPDAERDLWQGLAQLAVGLTHRARGNPPERAPSCNGVRPGSSRTPTRRRTASTSPAWSPLPGPSPPSRPSTANRPALSASAADPSVEPCVLAPSLRGLEIVDDADAVTRIYGEPADCGTGWASWTSPSCRTSSHGTTPRAQALDAVAEKYRAAGVAHRTLRDGQVLVVDGGSTTLY